jgi:uroporphyrinogen-III decarboxylase
MTSRERLLCALRGGTPDRVPVAPFGLGRIAPDSPLGQELIEGTDLLFEVWSGGEPLLGSDLGTSSDTDGDTTTILIETPGGKLRRRIRRTSVTSATVEFPLKSAADAEAILELPYVAPEANPADYHKWRKTIGEQGFVMVGIGSAVCLAAEWFSPEQFALMWAERPDLLIRMTATASERLIAYVESLCKAGVEGFRIVGGEYVSVQLGPRAFRELVIPFDTELARVIHQHGAVAYYHNHGRVTRYLPLLADLGMDALDPLEAPPWGDVDLAHARRAVGGQLCLVGNLDDMEIVDALPTEEVVAIARERLRAAGRRAFVLGGTASGSYGERGARNFLAMADMVARGG